MQHQERLVQRNVPISSESTEAIALAMVLEVSRSDVWLATCLLDAFDLSLDKVLALQVGDVSIWENRGKRGVEVRLNRAQAEGGVSMIVPAEALSQAAHLRLSSKLAESTLATDMLFNFTEMEYDEETSRIARVFFPGIAQSAGILGTPNRNKWGHSKWPLGLMTSCLRWAFESAPEDLCVAFLLRPMPGRSLSWEARSFEILKCKLRLLRGLGPESTTYRLPSNLLFQLAHTQVPETRCSAAMGTGRKLADVDAN